MSAFVRKFAKHRCVLYLAKDGLAPQHESDESAVREMLKKYEGRKKQGTETKPLPTDKCFRCNALGH